MCQPRARLPPLCIIILCVLYRRKSARVRTPAGQYILWQSDLSPSWPRLARLEKAESCVVDMAW